MYFTQCEISTNHLSQIERHHIIFLFDAKPNPATPKKISSTHADKYLISPSSSYRPSLLLPILPLSLFFRGLIPLSLFFVCFFFGQIRLVRLCERISLLRL